MKHTVLVYSEISSLCIDGILSTKREHGPEERPDSPSVQVELYEILPTKLAERDAYILEKQRVIRAIVGQREITSRKVGYGCGFQLPLVY